jgi:SAM-dependent methyltransferase
MNGRFQRRIQRYGWDRAVGHYERYWQSQLAPAQDRMMEIADLQPGERVLDLACGTGLVTFRAAEAVGEEGEVVATDISQKMVEEAGSRAAARGLSNVTFERVGAEESHAAHGEFDAALCGLGIMYFPEPLTAAREMHAALKPGGRAAVSVWGRRDRCGWAEIFEIVDARVRSQVCPMFFQQGTGDVLEGTLSAAGFGDLRVERLTTILEYDSPDDALGAAFAGGPVALAYSKFDDATRESAHAEYLESIEPYRSGEGYEIPGEFVVAGGRKE